MTHGSELPRSPEEPEAVVAPSSTSLLRVAVSESRPGVLVVSPVGEVDVASADVLREAAQDAVAAAPRCLVIDLGGITFCGSTGLVVLLDASRSAAAAGVRFRTVDGPPIVRRVLEITQLGPVLGHQETLDDAVRDLIG